MKKFFTDNIAIVAIVTFVLAGVAAYVAFKNAKELKTLVVPTTGAVTPTGGNETLSE